MSTKKEIEDALCAICEIRNSWHRLTEQEMKDLSKKIDGVEIPEDPSIIYHG